MKIERIIKGAVDKIELTKEGGTAYLKLDGKDLASRLFEAISGGPTLGFRVTEAEAHALRVGDPATIKVEILGK